MYPFILARYRLEQGFPSLQPFKSFYIRSGPRLDGWALCRQLRVVLHHNYFLHCGHHPLWLGISSPSLRVVPSAPLLYNQQFEILSHTFEGGGPPPLKLCRVQSEEWLCVSSCPAVRQQTSSSPNCLLHWKTTMLHCTDSLAENTI